VKEAGSMREQADELMANSRGSSNVCSHEILTIVVYYCQNFEVPFFGSSQPGDTYYFTPETVNGLGIVDCRREKDQLKLYVYGEDKRAKGGNNVASIIVHFLEERGLLDGHKRKTLNIITDNCGGQNKNRHMCYDLHCAWFTKVVLPMLSLCSWWLGIYQECSRSPL
jgi:hypothetical protein